MDRVSHYSASVLDALNNNKVCGEVERATAFPRATSATTTAEFARSRELMAALCTANPQFTASVLEDYIRPVFRWVQPATAWEWELRINGEMDTLLKLSHEL